MGEGDARVGLEPRLAAVESTHRAASPSRRLAESADPAQTPALDDRSRAADEDTTRAVAFATQTSSPVRVHPRDWPRVNSTLCRGRAVAPPLIEQQRLRLTAACPASGAQSDRSLEAGSRTRGTAASPGRFGGLAVSRRMLLLDHCNSVVKLLGFDLGENPGGVTLYPMSPEAGSPPLPGGRRGGAPFRPDFVRLRILLTSASVSLASRSCVAWSWCAQASIHNPAFSILSSAQCSTYSSTSARVLLSVSIRSTVLWQSIRSDTTPPSRVASITTVQASFLR